MNQEPTPTSPAAPSPTLTFLPYEYTLSFRRVVHNVKWLSAIVGRVFPPSAGNFFTREGEAVEREEVRSRIRGKRGLVLICGYNSSVGDAQRSYDTITRGLRAVGAFPYEFVVYVQWPTSTKPAFYFAEAKVYFDGLPGKWDDGVGNRLRDVLKDLPYDQVDVIAHSLGNGVILDALRAADVTGIRHLFLTNAAVEDWSVCSGHKYAHGVAAIAGKAVVFFSRRDAVLGAVYRASNIFLATALGFSGPAPNQEVPSTVEAVDATDWCLGHSDARNHVEYYSEMKQRIRPTESAGEGNAAKASA